MFTWIFLIFGVFAPIGFVLGVIGYHYKLSLYGLDTEDPMSSTGICILCILIMVFPVYFSGPDAKTSFRLELVFLLFFLNKLLKIKYAWENYVHA